MSKALQIELTCTGDPLTAINQAINIAKAINDTVYVKFYDFPQLISMHKKSNALDIFTIVNLHSELQKQK